MLAVRPLAEFDCHRDRNGCFYSLYDRRREGKVAHKRASVSGSDYLAHGTAHINIEYLRLGYLQRERRRFRHYIGLVPEDLAG